MKKLQNYKNGGIYKQGDKYLYITESGKTKREYNSIKELVDGEQDTKPKRKEASATLVVETTQEAQTE